MLGVNNMTEKEKDFFNRKLQSTTGDDHQKVVNAIVTRFVKEIEDKMIKEKEKKERNDYYKKTNFGL